MATKKQDFLIKSTDIRKQINSEFDHLIERVNKRRNELLSKLDDVVSSYQRLVRESEQAIIQLEQLKSQSRAVLNLNLTQGTQNAVMYEVENGIANLKGEMSNFDLSFEWTDDFEEMIIDLGAIIVNFNQFDCGTPKIDYSLMNFQQPSAKTPTSFQNTSQSEAETPEILEDIPYEETDITLFSEDIPSDSSTEQDSDLSSQPNSTVDTEQISQVVQQASKALTRSQGSLVDYKPTKQTGTNSTELPNPLTGTLYRCPYCSRCMGYAILQLQRHYRKYVGSCVSCKTNGDHFICCHCETDYTTEFTLTNHTKKFNGSCKQYQIDQSNDYLKRKSDGNFLPQWVQEDIQCLQPIQPTVEGDITPILPFKHKGHLIPVVNNAYNCPWCLRIFGTKQGIVRRHLSSPTGVCHRNKVKDDLPQCVVCLSHFSATQGLLKHTNNFRGSCIRRGSVKDCDKVDFLKPVKRSKRKRASLKTQSLIHCEHCDRCMGYDYRNLKNHLSRTQGKCQLNPLQSTYSCEDCKFEFTFSSALNKHIASYNGRCIEY